MSGDWVGNPQLAQFEDEQILYDTVGEAGISYFASDWSWRSQQAQMIAIGQGIVRFGQRLAQGLAQLRNLLGSGAIIKYGSLAGHPNALPPGTQTVHMPYSDDVTFNRQTIVHELAHVIDWHSRIRLGSSKYGWSNFSAAWQGAPLTNYAACTFFEDMCVNAWERWAEAVSVWVFGHAYAPNSRMPNVSAVDLGKQMTRVGDLLNGWR